MEAALYLFFDLTGIFKDLYESVSDQVSDAIDFIFSPIWLWWGIGVGVAVVLGAAAFFVPFRWFRGLVGGILILGGSFLAGGTLMHREMSAKYREEREKRRKLEKEVKELKRRGNTSPSGGRSFWPFGMLLFVLLPTDAYGQVGVSCKARYSCAQIMEAYVRYGRGTLEAWANQCKISPKLRAAVLRCITNSRRSVGVSHTN